MCRSWYCGWRVSDGLADRMRPDRSHVVFNAKPEDIPTRIRNGRRTGEIIEVPWITLWCDPGYPNAWRSPDVYEAVHALGEQGIAVMVECGLTKRSLLVSGQVSVRLNAGDPAKINVLEAPGVLESEWPASMQWERDILEGTK